MRRRLESGFREPRRLNRNWPARNQWLNRDQIEADQFDVLDRPGSKFNSAGSRLGIILCRESAFLRESRRLRRRRGRILALGSGDRACRDLGLPWRLSPRCQRLSRAQPRQARRVRHWNPPARQKRCLRPLCPPHAHRRQLPCRSRCGRREAVSFPPVRPKSHQLAAAGPR